MLVFQTFTIFPLSLLSTLKKSLTYRTHCSGWPSTISDFPNIFSTWFLTSRYSSRIFWLGFSEHFWHFCIDSSSNVLWGPTTTAEPLEDTVQDFLFKSGHETMHLCLFHSFFCQFWQRSYKNTKILRNLCLLFAWQDGNLT